MILKFIKPYTKPSGRVIIPGALGEFDSEFSQQLISTGYAVEFASSTSEVGCAAMLSKNHLIMGAHDLVKSIDPESIESNNKFK